MGLGDDVAFKQDSKAWQVYLAVVGEEPNDSADTSVVVGGRLMARMELSENGKRNRLGYNSIGAAPSQGAGESDDMGGGDRAGEGSLRDAQHRAAETSGGWYVEGEPVPDPEPPEETW